MNATNARLHWELTKVWGVANDDVKTKVVVITGAGDKAILGRRRPELGDRPWSATPAAIGNVMNEASDIVYNVMACEKPGDLGDQTAWPSAPAWPWR